MAARPKPPIARHRARLETVLRVAAPFLDLTLAAGDRVSRAVDRDHGEPPPIRVGTSGRGLPAGPGAQGSD